MTAKLARLVDDYELGKLLREREATLPDPVARAQDLLYRLARDLQEARMALDFSEQENARARYSLSKSSRASWKDQDERITLRAQVAKLTAAPKPRGKKGKASP